MLTKETVPVAMDLVSYGPSSRSRILKQVLSFIWIIAHDQKNDASLQCASVFLIPKSRTINERVGTDTASGGNFDVNVKPISASS